MSVSDAVLLQVSARAAVSGEILCSINIRSDETVCALRASIGRNSTHLSGVGCSFRLLFGGVCLDALPGASVETAFQAEGRTLADVGLTNGCEIQVVFCRCTLVTTSNDNTARLWDPETGACLHELAGHFGQIYAAVFSPDSREVVTASEDSTARIWSVETGICRATLSGHQGEVFSAIWSPDGSFVATASEDSTSRLWDACDGACLQTFLGHIDQIFLAVFSPDGFLVLTCSEDKTARIYESATAAVSSVLQGHGAAVWRAEFAPDGELVVTASLDCTARIWRHSEAFAEVLHIFADHGEPVKFATFSPDGQLIASTSDKGRAILWSATTGEIVLELDGHSDDVYTAAFSPDGRKVLTTCEDGHARIWDVPPKISNKSPPFLKRSCCNIDLIGHSDAVSWADFSMDGRFVVTTSWDETALVWEAGSGECVMELVGHAAPLVYGAFSA